MACSETVRNVFGYAPDEVVGRGTPLLYDDRRPPQRPRAIFEAVERLGFHVGQAVGRRKNGETFPIEIATAKLRGSRGVVLLIHDVSERQRLEQALVDAYADLERRVAERTEELRRANRELVRSEQRLRALAAEVVFAEERERRRIALNLHDSVGQTLALCRMKLAALTTANGNGRRAEAPQELRELIDAAISETRSLTGQLSPPALYELGLDAALEWLAEHMGQRFQVPIAFVSDEQPKRLDETQRIVLFRAVRELVFNAVKHARPNQIRVSSRLATAAVHLTVEDNGQGFDAAAADDASSQRGGFGLFNIRERLAALGGRLTLTSRPGQGTRIVLTLPLTPPRPGAEQNPAP